MNPSTFGHQWRHTHVFDTGNPLAERNTRWAVVLTVVTMVAEIIGGWKFNSMALLADGWHMSSHAIALGLAVFAYSAARGYAQDARFSFGTWKIEILGGYTSAILLVGVAGLMLFQSIERLITPSPIHYNEAIALALIGLVVNLVCAWLLRDVQHDHHGHDHDHHAGHHGHQHDLNQRSAYVHVMTDAATSALAIIALFGGKFFDARWLDPAMGIVGSIVVAVWAYGLLRDAGRILLDAEMDTPIVGEIHEVVATLLPETTITDLHVWRVGKARFACIVSLATTGQLDADEVRQRLSIHEELVHITVEINRPGER